MIAKLYYPKGHAGGGSGHGVGASRRGTVRGPLVVGVDTSFLWCPSPPRRKMMDDVMPLDGNAAAGRLADLFAGEMTRATIVCDGCGRECALATLKYYGGAGVVLRCPTCEAVILRLLDTGRTLNLDLRGCTRLTVRTRSGAGSSED